MSLESSQWLFLISSGEVFKAHIVLTMMLLKVLHVYLLPYFWFVSFSIFLGFCSSSFLVSLVISFSFVIAESSHCCCNIPTGVNQCHRISSQWACYGSWSLLYALLFQAMEHVCDFSYCSLNFLLCILGFESPLFTDVWLDLKSL